MQARGLLFFGFLCCSSLLAISALAEEPTPKPENTISITLENEIKPQAFPRPIKFFVDKVIDRSANPQPMRLLKERGGVFLDKQPTEIVQSALESVLKKADLLAADSATADYLLTVYIFHFGLGSGLGNEYYGKVDLNIVVKDVKNGTSQQVTALGTSVQGAAVRKKNILKNIEANISEALESALRNFLRGTKLRDAVAPATDKPAETPQASLRRSEILLSKPIFREQV